MNSALEVIVTVAPYPHIKAGESNQEGEKEVKSQTKVLKQPLFLQL